MPFADVMCNDSHYEDIFWNTQGKMAFSEDYGTSRIGNASTAWLKEVVGEKHILL